MRQTRATLLSFVSSALLLYSTGAAAYGPYTHYQIGRDAAKRLGLDATASRYYALGALLADIDKSGRLAATFKSKALVRVLQGCSAQATVTRAATHAPTGALVMKLLGSTDARARALGLGIRNHGVSDRFADTTGKARHGRANSGEEDLAFDLSYTRARVKGVASELKNLVRKDTWGLAAADFGAVAKWLADAAGQPASAVKKQLRGYWCFVRKYVVGKAALLAPALKIALKARWVKECAAKSRGWRAKLRCAKRASRKTWNAFLESQRKLAAEALAAAVADAKKAR